MKFDYRDVLVFALWAIVFGINYFLFLYNHPALKDQQINYAFAFCPVNIFSRDFYNFIVTQFNDIFFQSLLEVSQAYGFTYVFLALFGIGLINVLRPKNIKLFIFSLLPVLLHLALSALKMYPFWYRLILYLLPGIIIIVAVGTYTVGNFLSKRVHLYAGAAVVLVCMVFFVKRSIADFPSYPLDIKPVINYVNKYPANTHIYITTPINPYRYYHILGYARDTPYKEVQWAPWWPTMPKEFDELVYNEKSNYLFVYGSNYHGWGYGKVIDYLYEQGRIVKSFEQRGYIVSEVKPENKDSLVVRLDYTYYDPSKTWKDDYLNQVFMPMWGNDAVEAKPISLSPGKYSVTVVSKGGEVDGVYCHNNLYVNNMKLGDFTSTYLLGRYKFYFEVKDNNPVVIKVDMDNDAAKEGHDRNSFISYIDIGKVK
jgi:hypothetical protein